MQKSDKIYVIGDVHGCYKTLKSLLKKLPKNAKICFVGDLIDRGENSADVVELVISEGYFCTLGNHEYRLLKSECDFLKNKIPSDLSWFYQNGGEATFKSYLGRDDLRLKHVEFFKNLPIFLEFNELKDSQNRHLVVSHSAVGKMWGFRNNPNLKDDFRRHVISGRGDTHENKGIFNIFGHTPLNEPMITEHFANIDLGAAYRFKAKNPRLCAISYPDLEIFTQENVDF